MSKEISDIQRILGKKVSTDETISHYSVSEKCNAILSWKRANNMEFDTYFVESVLKYSEKYHQITSRQEQSLDVIINKYNINLDMH